MVLAGAIGPLAKALHSTSNGLVLDAARALGNIAAGSQANRDALVENDAVEPLVAASRSSDVSVCEQAAMALADIAVGSSDNRRALRTAGYEC